jgi:hypothetical protein
MNNASPNILDIKASFEAVPSAANPGLADNAGGIEVAASH